MDFKNKLFEFSAKVSEIKKHLATEESTKNALILPFLQIMGYDPFNPTEIYPEYISDVGTKKGEKVDYAIMLNNEPIILIECKCNGSDLDQGQCNQLYRYFTNTTARIAILTNGIEYRFFSDLDKSNLMDSKPFMVFSIDNPEDALIPELKKLTKQHFDLNATISAANELKYTREIKKLIANEVAEPSEEFVRFFASKVYSGRLTQQVREWFAGIVKRSVSHYINDVINDRLASAMSKNQYEEGQDNLDNESAESENKNDLKPGIITTLNEKEAFLIIKSILREVIDPSRVALRDTKSYCGVLLDDNNRKPICRLYLETKNWYIGIFNSEKDEERFQIQNLNEIFQYSDKIKELPVEYNV